MRIELPPLKTFVLKLEEIMCDENILHGKKPLCISTLTHGVHAFLYLFFEQHNFMPVRLPLHQVYSKASLIHCFNFVRLQAQCEANPVIIIEYTEKLDKNNYQSFLKAVNKGFYNEQGQKIPVIISTEKNAFQPDFFYTMNRKLHLKPQYLSVNSDLDDVRWVKKKYYQLKDESDTLFTTTKYEALKTLVSHRKKNRTILLPQREKIEFQFSFFKKVFDYLPQHLKKHLPSTSHNSANSDKHHGIVFASNTAQSEALKKLNDHVSNHSPEDYTREMQPQSSSSDKNKKQTI
jgi:hypothetical protein